MFLDLLTIGSRELDLTCLSGQEIEVVVREVHVEVAEGQVDVTREHWRRKRDGEMAVLFCE